MFHYTFEVLCLLQKIYFCLSLVPFNKGKGKGKAVPLHAMEALGGERRYSSYSYLTSALDGGEWSASRPGRTLPPGGKDPGTH
jgi:hypothetical protein